MEISGRCWIEVNNSSKMLDAMLVFPVGERRRAGVPSHLWGSHDLRITLRMVNISLEGLMVAGMGQTRRRKRIYLTRRTDGRTTLGRSASGVDAHAFMKILRLSENCFSESRRFSSVEKITEQREESVCRKAINSRTAIYIQSV